MEISRGPVRAGLVLTCAGEALATLLVAALLKGHLLMTQAIRSEDGFWSRNRAKPVDAGGDGEDGGDNDNGYGGFGGEEDFSSEGEENGNPNQYNSRTPKKSDEGGLGRDIGNGDEEDDEGDGQKPEDDDEEEEEEDGNGGEEDDEEEEEEEEQVVEEETEEEEEDEALQPPKKRKK